MYRWAGRHATRCMVLAQHPRSPTCVALEGVPVPHHLPVVAALCVVVLPAQQANLLTQARCLGVGGLALLARVLRLGLGSWGAGWGTSAGQRGLAQRVGKPYMRLPARSDRQQLHRCLQICQPALLLQLGIPAPPAPPHPATPTLPSRRAFSAPNSRSRRSHSAANSCSAALASRTCTCGGGWGEVGRAGESKTAAWVGLRPTKLADACSLR
mgnify:CR=1 FL=1